MSSLFKRRTKGEVVFTFVCYLLITLLAISTLLPFLHVISKAVSSEGAVITGSILFWPIDFQTGTLHYVLDTPEFLNGLKVSVIVTIFGTILAMLLTVTVAYPLSKPQMVGRKFFVLMFVFVMLFSGGMIPNYMLYKSLGLLNTLWALMFPGMMSVFNMLLVKTFYEQLPESIEESARIDGASNMTLLFRIVIPMSMPVIATVSLYYAVGYWNSYFSGVLYITKTNLRPLQQYLFELVTATMKAFDPGTVEVDMDKYMNILGDSVRSATIVLSTVPILCVYPFLQKHFVKGVQVGSVKG